MQQKIKDMRKRKIETSYKITDMTTGEIWIDEPKDLRTVKTKIYSKGNRGNQYQVIQIIKTTKYPIREYILKYTKEGPIFQRKIWDKFEEDKQKAKVNQLNIFI
ncbi:hypothetical protein [Sigmofec virus UA08Rod_4510]|uniref:Uncharacterized protein n=1 Tax=Sigmofec virus UA08Rod_4510 TaxID=2929402 RepID=A0A976N1X6_9VIRU|nr:hypothetical protein [Sigmofec virus UA08Rod_4510]